MKNKHWLGTGTLVAACGLIVCRFSSDELPLSDKSIPVPQPQPAARSTNDTRGASTESILAHSFSPALLTETAERLGAFTRLRALPDDIETFRMSADIENAFNNALNPAKAAYLIQNMPAGFTDSYFGALCLHRWASAERIAAAEWMKTHPSDQPSTAQALAEGWLASDRESLATYLDQLPAGSWKDNLACSASEDAFLAKEPVEVVNFLKKTSGSNARRDQLLEWNTTAWAMKDHAAAVSWVEQTAHVERRPVLLAAAATGYAHTDPLAAINWALTHVSESTALQPTTKAIVRIWAAKDPSAALQWVTQLPAGPVRDNATDGLVAIAKPEDDQD